MKNDRTNRWTSLASSLALASALALPAIAAPTAAHAQDGAQRFDIAAGDLARALQDYSAATGVQLVYSSELVADKRSPGVSGSLSRGDALARLLGGTGLMARISGNSATITPIADAVAPGEGERVLGAVRVEGEQSSPYFGGAGKMAGVNGINGSRDITATEGTGSFTSGALTIGSKVPQAMKDVPQSISVLTSERMEQQNVTDFTTAMKQLPGVTLVQGQSSLENTFYSRGFAIKSIQIDGGAPLYYDYGYQPQIDMSIYDHVELLRGAAGLFNGYGDPSGTVNLVRKKPLDHAQYSLEAQAGSWSNYRVVADATSPLALDGRLRGRLVMTYQDQRYFYDIAKLNKSLIYGIAEFDATPTTLVSAGINYTRQDSVPWFGGLPRYLNGDDLMLPRATSLAFPWNRWDFDTREIFGTVEQKIGSDWTLKLNLTQSRQASTKKIGYSNGAVNPENGLGPGFVFQYSDYANEQFSAEATLAGAFNLFGQRQEVTIGANRGSSDGGGQLDYSAALGTASNPYRPYPGGPIYCSDFSGGCPVGSIPRRTPPVDVLNFDPNDPLYNEPPNPLPSFRYNELGQVQSGVYVNLRLTAFDRLHLTTGLRWSRYEAKYAYDYLCTITTLHCAGKDIGDAYFSLSQPYSDDDFSWPPPVNLSFDVTKALTVYAGYTDIYQSQATYLDVNEKPVDPVTGSNWEGGVKWAARDGRLNLSLAAYRIQSKGGAQPDPNSSRVFEQVPPGSGIYCCFVADDNYVRESKGIDLEITGEVRPGWQISASYVYNDNEIKGSIAELYGQLGAPVVSIAPKHLYKLWMSYDFGAGGDVGALSGLTISGGVNGQSSGYNSGNTCIRFIGIPDSLTGAQTCAPNTDPANPSRIDYHFIVPPHALLSARIDYRFSNKWSLAVNLENILDKTYYQTTGLGVSGGHWYGAPRNVTVSLRGKF